MAQKYSIQPIAYRSRKRSLTIVNLQNSTPSLDGAASEWLQPIQPIIQAFLDSAPPPPPC